MSRELRYGEIGYWSDVKLDIIRDYAAAYSRILSSQRSPKFCHLYIDAFAGAGLHRSKSTGEFVPGSPANALLVNPPFREYHFIDLDEMKAESLEGLAGTREDVKVYRGDCNQILFNEVLLEIPERRSARISLPWRWWRTGTCGERGRTHI